MFTSATRPDALLQDMVRILAGAETVSAATASILAAIGTHGDWRFGALWTLGADGQLHCEGVWQSRPGRTQPLAEVNGQALLPPNAGLPGEAFAAGAPVWMGDVATNPRFLRGAAAAASRLTSGLAFPLAGSQGPVGVLEFLTDRPDPPSEELLELVTTLGRQVGQYIERRRAEEAMLRSEAVKDAIVRTSLDALVGMDADGRVVEWNPAAEVTFGYSRDQALGRIMAELIVPPWLRDAHHHGLAHHLATGETRVLNRRIEIAAMRRDGSEFPVELSITRQDVDGAARFTGHLRDLTELKAIEGELRRSRDELAAILEAVGDSVTARAPDGTLIYANPAALAAMGRPNLEALRSVSVEELVAELRPVDEQGVPLSPGEFPYRRVLAGEDEAQAVVGYRRPGQDTRWTLARSRAIRDEQGELLMVLTVAEDITARKREERKLRDVSETLQASILPAELPVIPGVDLAVAFTPRGGEHHEVGGDFYDAFALDDERWLLSVGDVCGKGPEAAALTSLCRYTIRALSLHEEDPAALLGELNEALLRHRTDGRFATAALARLARLRRGLALTLALGGHPCPMVLRADGGLSPAGDPGVLLGVERDRTIATDVEIALGLGDALVFYTDGVTDARDATGAQFDLRAHLAGCRGLDAEEIALGVQEAALAHQDGAAFDDIALMVVRVPDAPLLQRRFPAEAASVAPARHAIDELAGHHPQLDWDTVALMVSELVTNSIVHGHDRREEQWFELIVTERAGTRLRFCVADPGPPFIARRREAAPDAESGRGLFLVDSLADRWGVARTGQASIWFECDLR
ncbi:MAG TPA: SpoIIE family protein phosphatase [Solirubrobacteraceae bacterium]|nr:SpoIIE family protein phosphatase [Solirubrobacteraceae bacterium]